MGSFFKAGFLLVIVPLLLLSQYAGLEASKYHARAMETSAALAGDQAAASANLEQATKDQAIAGKDQAAETADEAREEEDKAAAEKDRLRAETSEAEAQENKGKAAEEQGKANSARAEAEAAEAAADAKQAEATAHAGEGAAAEAETAADETAEAVLNFVPYARVAADTVGTAVAAALQAKAASEEAASAAVESESIAQRAAEAEARAAAVASEATEAEAAAAGKASEESAAAAKSDEAEKDADAAESEADAARQEKDRQERLAKGAGEDSAAATEEADAVELLDRLMLYELMAFIFALVSYAAVALPALYVVCRRLFRACRRLCLCFAWMRPKQQRALAQPLLDESSRATGPWQRDLVEPLHFLMVAIALVSAMLPVVAPGVEMLGRKQLELEDFSLLVPLTIQLVRNIFGWSMITFVVILLVEIGVSLERMRLQAQVSWYRRLFRATSEAVPQTLRAVCLALALSVFVLCLSRGLRAWLPYEAVWQLMGSMQLFGGVLAAAVGALQATLRARYPPTIALDTEAAGETEETETESKSAHSGRGGSCDACSFVAAGAIMMKRLVAALEGPLELLTLGLAWRGFFVSMGIVTLAWPYVAARLRQQSTSMLQLLHSAGYVIGFLFLVDLFLLLAPRLAAKCPVGGRQKSLTRPTRVPIRRLAPATEGAEEDSPTDYISIHVN